MVGVNSAVYPKGSHCNSCPFGCAGAGPRTRPVASTGSALARGVIVGEFPNHDEVEAGVPFVGRAGQQLIEELAAAGLRRSDLFLVNAIACEPPGNKTDAAMQAAVKACNGWFVRQVAHLPMSVPILALGKWAVAAVTGKFDKQGHRGFVRDSVVLPRAPFWTFDNGTK